MLLFPTVMLRYSRTIVSHHVNYNATVVFNSSSANSLLYTGKSANIVFLELYKYYHCGIFYDFIFNFVLLYTNS